MPNWCACSIKIEGSVEEMFKFYETLKLPNQYDKITKFSFHQTVPSPIELSSQESKWGTKWDACKLNICQKTDNHFLIQCDTAWSPPLNWAKNFHKIFQDLDITIAYCEVGMQFYGYWKQKNGQNITKQFDFANDDLVGIYYDENKNLKYTDYTSDDAIYCEASGYLKKFMKKYNISHIGG